VCIDQLIKRSTLTQAVHLLIKDAGRPAGCMAGWLAGGRVGDVSARGAGSEKFIFESETQLCHIDNGGNMVRGAHDLPKKLLPR
jgi:hypothetical protein